MVEDTTERIEKLSCCYLVFDAVGKLKCNHFDECDECMFKESNRKQGGFCNEIRTSLEVVLHPEIPPQMT